MLSNLKKKTFSFPDTGTIYEHAKNQFNSFINS